MTTHYCQWQNHSLLCDAAHQGGLVSRCSLLLDLHVCAGRSDDRLPLHAVAGSRGSSEDGDRKTGSVMFEVPATVRALVGAGCDCWFGRTDFGGRCDQIRRACLLPLEPRTSLVAEERRGMVRTVDGGSGRDVCSRGVGDCGAVKSHGAGVGLFQLACELWRGQYAPKRNFGGDSVCYVGWR